MTPHDLAAAWLRARMWDLAVSCALFAVAVAAAAAAWGVADADARVALAGLAGIALGAAAAGGGVRARWSRAVWRRW